MGDIHQSISQMCANLGQDRLLVQGAGGNVSWKEGEILWIKASGTWLANATKEDIFVPVDLKHLQNALSQKNFTIKPQVIATKIDNKLQPSIETVLHGLMPQKIVVHLHAINPLSHLVSRDCRISIAKICEQASINGVLVGYHKPGPDLAQAIYQSLQEFPDASVIFLKNHGIVVGAQTTEEIYSLLKKIDLAFAPKLLTSKDSDVPANILQSPVEGYTPLNNKDAQKIVFNQYLFKRLNQDWVLYPDHAVFLGPAANIYPSWEVLQKQNKDSHPELIFIENVGIFVKPEFNKAKVAQLLCYFDVINRVPPEFRLESLNAGEVRDLLNWDAERLRQNMAK
ncbi:hypothetical protein DCO17_01580 [Polynucleobacter tropicus]|uniref:Class II aldolase/adducin N-terminal domain-containing protein n=1 Tax=Polynucleobacter tropicus TaxID=1743174 RepID=A0A6M9Q5R3_9BURK|nr:class II aldolase/adducin family protein [Polynucleobacter tropicus]QKM64033.1 hypothetical protein DCO17_01580 [Polynucleobacter tropicus]